MTPIMKTDLSDELYDLEPLRVLNTKFIFSLKKEYIFTWIS